MTVLNLYFRDYELLLEETGTYDKFFTHPGVVGASNDLRARVYYDGVLKATSAIARRNLEGYGYQTKTCDVPSGFCGTLRVDIEMRSYPETEWTFKGSFFRNLNGDISAGTWTFHFWTQLQGTYWRFWFNGEEKASDLCNLTYTPVAPARQILMDGFVCITQFLRKFPSFLFKDVLNMSQTQSIFYMSATVRFVVFAPNFIRV